jgi:hypothetical protein
VGVVTDSNQNIGVGSGALQGNTSGQGNSALGYNALTSNTTGSNNTAVGNASQQNNSTGDLNTAIGQGSLFANTVGSRNTASGVGAIANGNGSDNNAYGYYALNNNNGSANNAFGSQSLVSNLGNNNNAFGSQALYTNISGSSNIAIGNTAGYNITGDNNIDIANQGVAGEAGTIRIGTVGTHTATFIAGISGSTTGLPGTQVVIDANGQLGTVSSSRRYKEEVRAMADASERLLKLRPVTFRYKKPNALGKKPIQYGLIAEEVADVFPELVVLNKDGQPETVAYHVLPALLLNEYQKEHRLNHEQGEKLALMQKQLDAQSIQLAEVDALKAKLANLERLTEALAAAKGTNPPKSEHVSQVRMDLSRTVVAAR